MRRGAAVLLVSLLVAGCGESAHESELLVFGVAPDYDEIAEEIVAVEPDGRGLRSLTRGVEGYAYDPVAAPDGRHIAFNVAESVAGPDSWLHVMASDGTDRRRLVPERDGFSDAVGWSPDGKRVLYALTGSRRGEVAGRGLWTVGIDGRGKRRLEPKGAWGEAVWSPDGSTIAFVTDEGTDTPAIHLVDVRERRSRLLVRDASSPRWTPDGRIVFKKTFAGKRSGIYVVERDGGRARLIERFGPDDDDWLGDVSPDGDWVLVGYHPAISKISLDDGKGQKLTEGESDWAPVWSPDGRRVAFERDGDIWVMNADGSDERVAARAPRGRVYTRPHWLP